jgi:hypothetical protein
MSHVVPIPVRLPLFAEPAGRPGDWWEPISLCAAKAAGQLHAVAHARHLPVDLLAALLVEHALIARDIADCGINAGRARAALAAAGEAQAPTGPGRLHTAYVRMLRSGEYDYEHEGEAQLAQRDLVLPLRLHEAARALDLRKACDADMLDEAIAWEISAATTGQFMREWVLRMLLLQTASRPALV